VWIGLRFEHNWSIVVFVTIIARITVSEALERTLGRAFYVHVPGPCIVRLF
jgi:hypothetical protein